MPICCERQYAEREGVTRSGFLAQVTSSRNKAPIAARQVAWRLAPQAPFGAFTQTNQPADNGGLRIFDISASIFSLPF
jgi:hypothetical protein